MNELDIDRLINSKDSNDRKLLNIEEIIDLSSMNFGRVLDLIDLEMKYLELEGKYHCDRWWDAFGENVKQDNPDRSYLGTRVRYGGESLVFEWHKRKVKKGGSGGFMGKYYATYLKKGSGSRYKDSIFSKEPEWAKELGCSGQQNLVTS